MGCKTGILRFTLLVFLPVWKVRKTEVGLDSINYNACPTSDLLNKCDKACIYVEKIMYNEKCPAE